MEYKSLNEVYFDTKEARVRYKEVDEKFSKSFGEIKANFWLRAPGRVNIIGEHIDYSYFACLPAAISADITMEVAISKGGNSVTVTNVADERFEDTTFEFADNGEVPIDAEHMQWANYFKCGFVVACRYLRQQLGHTFKPNGMLVTMRGDVPTGGGLSSSAAFVVSATLATLRANSYTATDKLELTKLSTMCEQLVGVNSGGLDQAASIYGQKDHALFVRFRPQLSAEPVTFPPTPEPLVLLIANSLVESNKHETGPVRYNLRVVEVTLAANLLAHKLGVSIPQDGNLQAGTLRGVLEAVTGKSGESSDALKEMLELVAKCLKPEGYTREEIAHELGIDSEDLHKRYMTTFPVRFDILKLQQRAEHVYSEALRVLQFVEVMRNPPSHADVTHILGQLMNESHESGRVLYENSVPDVDELVAIAREAGAAGSRSTGAGWGGCTVNLVVQSKVAQVRDAIMDKYYARKRLDTSGMTLLESRPGAGVAIFPHPEHLLD